MRPSSSHVPALAACLLAMPAAGCGRAPETPDAGGTPRIVSLSPAISRTLLDFDLGGRIVGRTAFCAALPQRIPVVGNLHEIDYERLIRLDPTHVLIQPPSATGVDPHLAQLARRRGWTLGSWTINTLDDIETLIRELPGVLYPDDRPRRAAASARAAELLSRIAAALSPGGEALFTGATLLVADTDPILVFGRQTYLHDVLAALGGANACAGRGWVELSVEDVLRLAPQAVVVVRDRGPPVDAGEAAGQLAALDTPARRAGRIAVLAHPDVLLPSSGVIEVAAALRQRLRELAAVEPP